MVSHPNRSGASFRFIAFDTIRGQSRAYAATATEALAIASKGLPDAAFIEILDCGTEGRKVWTGGVEPANPAALHRARGHNQTVFRGDGYAASFNPLPAVVLAVA